MLLYQICPYTALFHPISPDNFLNYLRIYCASFQMQASQIPSRFSDGFVDQSMTWHLAAHYPALTWQPQITWRYHTDSRCVLMTWFPFSADCIPRHSACSTHDNNVPAWSLSLAASPSPATTHLYCRATPTVTDLADPPAPTCNSLRNRWVKPVKCDQALRDECDRSAFMTTATSLASIAAAAAHSGFWEQAMPNGAERTG